MLLSLTVAPQGRAAANAATATDLNNSYPVVATTPLPPKGKAKIVEVNPNKFDVKCEGIEKVATSQKGPNLCWAACAEMLHRYNNRPLSQSDIALRIQGRRDKLAQGGSIEKILTNPGDIIGGILKRGGRKLVERTASPAAPDWTAIDAATKVEVWLAMNPERQSRVDASEDRQKNQFSFNMDFNTLMIRTTRPSTDDIVQEISSGRPVIIGIKPGADAAGHIVLAYGVVYSRKEPQGPAEYREMTKVTRDNNIGLPEIAAMTGRHSTHYIIHELRYIDPQPTDGSDKPVDESIPFQKIINDIDFYLSKKEALAKLDAYLEMWTPSGQKTSTRSRQGDASSWKWGKKL